MVTAVVPTLWVVPCVKSNAPAVVAALPDVNVPGVLMLPEVSIVAVADGVWSVVVPPPVTRAVEVSDPVETTVTVPVPTAVQDKDPVPAASVSTVPAAPTVAGSV